MYMEKRYKIVVYTPDTHADPLREAMASAGARKIGNYTQCSFTTKGYGRFLPEEGADPAIGEVGTLETVSEARIEVTCEEVNLREVLCAIREAHPYEEPATDVYLLENVS